MFLELWLHGTSFMFSYYLAKFWPILLAAGSMTFVGYTTGFEEITNKLLFVFTIEASVFAFFWCVVLQFARLFSRDRESYSHQETQKLANILLRVCIYLLNEISKENEESMCFKNDFDAPQTTSYESEIILEKEEMSSGSDGDNPDESLEPQECNREQKNTQPEVIESNCSES